jgi:hypothetical protein
MLQVVSVPLVLSGRLDRRRVVRNGQGARSVHNSPSKRMPLQCQVLVATPIAIDPTLETLRNFTLIDRQSLAWIA